MEAIQQARKLFLKCHAHQASLKDSDKQQLSRDIQRFISIAIKEATSKDLFENPLMLEVLKAALKQRAKDNSDVMPVARAFQSLEKYFMLLVEQPWKAEFREIKMYGGFYRTRIKSVLPDCESIFKHAGYSVNHDSSTMVHHKEKINKNFLLLLAFDCRVGQVECETIAEFYNKVKGLSMSLEDAIGNILHDEYSRDKLALKYSYPHGNGLIINTTLSSSVAPPALPKREPISNSSNSRHKITCGSESPMYNNSAVNMLDRAGIAFPPKSPSRTLDLYPSVSTKSPITPSGVNPDSFTYMDALSKEIHHDLPQGTLDDHLSESLRQLNGKDICRPPVTGSWKPYGGYVNDSRVAAGPNQFSLAAPTSYAVNGLKPAGSVAQSNFMPNPSIDEGIEQDMSTCRMNPHSAKYSSVGGHQAVSGRHQGHQQQVSFDQGYRTVTPESMYSPSTAGYLPNVAQQTIYHPPSVAPDCAGSSVHNATFVPRHSAPPPIPSRALKPKTVKDEDALLQSKMYPSVPLFFSQPAGASHMHSEIMLSRPPLSAPGYSTIARSYNIEPVMHRERLLVSKTNSLKTGDPNSIPLSQQAASGRVVRSMDIAANSWECPSCRTLNAALSIKCFACSYSRLGPELISPTTGEAKLSCPTCTFANNLNETHCEMCGSKLRDKFTQV